MNAKEFLKEKRNWNTDSRGMFDFNGLASILTEYAKDLQQHKDTTVGLWATDRPEMVKDEYQVMFKIE